MSIETTDAHMTFIGPWDSMTLKPLIPTYAWNGSRTSSCRNWGVNRQASI